jgi:hypothetical protein
MDSEAFENFLDTLIHILGIFSDFKEIGPFNLGLMRSGGEIGRCKGGFSIGRYPIDSCTTICTARMSHYKTLNPSLKLGNDLFRRLT